MGIRHHSHCDLYRALTNPHAALGGGYAFAGHRRWRPEPHYVLAPSWPGDGARPRGRAPNGSYDVAYRATRSSASFFSAAWTSSTGVWPRTAFGSSLMAWAFHSSHQNVCQTFGNVAALTTLSITGRRLGSGNHLL